MSRGDSKEVHKRGAAGESISSWLDNGRLTLAHAHAIAWDAILVTNNQRELTRVSGLRHENWV